MKGKFIAAFLVALISLPSFAGNYSEAKSLLGQIAAVWTALADSLDRADSAASVAAALDAMTDKMAVIYPKWRQLEAKQPEIKTMEPVPPELEAEVNMLKQQSERLRQHFMNIDKMYKDDVQVRNAKERLDKVMR